MYWLQCTSWWSWFGIGGCSLSTFEASLRYLYIGVGMYKYRKREEKFVGIENKKALGIWAGERGQLLMVKLRTGMYSQSATVESWKDTVIWSLAVLNLSLILKLCNYITMGKLFNFSLWCFHISKVKQVIIVSVADFKYEKK